ncbi:MAG: glycosyltransferase, partial [Deltaproteobacteria bacterium]
MRKVLHIIPSLQKGGAERLVLDICNALNTKKDVRVKLITFRDQNEYTFLTKKIDHSVIPASYTPSFTGKDEVNVDQLLEAINSFQPDIIHSHLFESEMVLSAVHYPAAKYFVHFHDNIKQLRKPGFKRFFSKQNLTDAYERKLVLNSYAKKAVSFIAVSTHTKQFILDNLPRRHTTSLLHNAINVERFSNDSSQRDLHRLVMIGSLVPKKNQQLAIRVIADLNSRGHQFHLDLLGEGQLRSELEQLAQELKVEDFVHFHGNVDNPEAFLAKAGIYLHTAKYEPFGLVLLEAMSAGSIVISTNGGGNMDLLN